MHGFFGSSGSQFLMWWWTPTITLLLFLLQNCDLATVRSHHVNYLWFAVVSGDLWKGCDSQVENHCFRGRFSFVLMKDFRNIAGALMPMPHLSCEQLLTCLQMGRLRLRRSNMRPWLQCWRPAGRKHQHRPVWFLRVISAASGSSSKVTLATCLSLRRWPKLWP